jgi:hypothetical protein
MKKTILSIAMACAVWGLQAQYQNVSGVRVGEQGHGAAWTGISHNALGVTGGNYMIIQSNDGNYTLVNKTNTGAGFIGFRVGNADKMAILNNGNVGIGTTTPSYPLHVKGRIYAEQGNDGGMWCAPNRFVGAGNDFVGLFNGAWNLTLRPDGKVTVGSGLIIGNKFQLSRSSNFSCCTSGGTGICTDDYLRLTDVNNNAYLKFAAAEIFSANSLTVSGPACSNRFYRFFPHPTNNDNLVFQRQGSGQTGFEVRSNMGYDAGANAYAMGQLIFTNIAPAQSDPNIFYSKGLHAVIGSASRQGDFGLRVFGIKVNGNAQNDNLYDLITVEKEHPDDLILLDGATSGDKVKVRGEICVTANGTCDYVFKDDYKLRSIEELEQFIKQNGHLPGVKNDKEVKAAGEVNLLEQSNALLEKTEEFSLYIIELNKQLAEQKKLNTELKTRLDRQQQQIEQLLKK